jgi:hypothetical protein
MSRIISSPTTVLNGGDARWRTGLEFLRRHDIDRQHYFALLDLGLAKDVERRLGKIMLAQRFSDRPSLRREKGVGDAAADDQRVDLGEEIAKQIELR